jgi:DNA-binding transcriptional ArsR family regulator
VSKTIIYAKFLLDIYYPVTLWLRIMRNRSVTDSLDQSAEATFQALADPTRRAVLDLLRRGSQPAGHIASAFPVSRPAISKHLKLLRRAHLVREHREGRHRVYQLNPEPLRAVDSWLEQYRNFWKMNLASLKNFVESEYAKETQQHVKPIAKSKGDLE